MSEKEQFLTWYFEGPVSLSSMAAQAFLHFGMIHARKEEAGWVLSVSGEEGDYRAALSFKGRVTAEKDHLTRRRDIEHFLMDALAGAAGRPLGRWGYLLGMRPVKALYPFLSFPVWKEKAARFLQQERVAEDMQRLLLAAAERQRLVLRPDGERTASFYVHIPFCPSHCVYCSFPSEIVRPGEALEAYTEALCEDIRAAGHLAVKKQLTIESVYFGGGTPTILTAPQLDRVLAAVERYVLRLPGAEWTVEAGRPDTIDEERLSVLAAHGVTRISINPQTMQDRLLSLISRSHKGKDIYRAFEKARKYSFQSINMDFICGLPQQRAADMEENLRAICQLRPENVTIHTLTVKRGSPFYRREEEFVLPPEAEVAKMLASAQEALQSLGYHPYYLYRQKYMTDDFANVGYALPGHDSVYNIQMIGEHQHVIGAGAGAVSKAVLPGGYRLKKLYMPRSPALYRKNLSALMEERAGLYQDL